MKSKYPLAFFLAAGPCKTAAAVTVALAFSACSSLKSWSERATSPLPIEVTPSGASQKLSVYTYEISERLYVAGTARKPALTNPVHVDVQLISRSGRVVAERQYDIDPARAALGGGRRSDDTYVASFPLSEARQASRIRITYHNSNHLIN